MRVVASGPRRGQARGRLEAATDGRRPSTEYGFAAIPLAAHAAIWLRDGERALAVVEAAHGWYSPALEADVATIRAGLEALAGNEQAALAGYQAAQVTWRELGCDFEPGPVCTVDMATLLGPGHPEVVAAADEARTILERLRARPFADRLEAAMSAAPESSASTAAEPATSDDLGSRSEARQV